MTNAFNLSQLANNTNSSGQVSLGTGVSGTLPSANGGTGTATSTGTGSLVLSNSPTFTGVPLSTTAANGTNTTQLATTAFAYGAKSAATSGYTMLANGLVIQWGQTAAIAAGTPTATTFPLTFPTAIYSVTITPFGIRGGAGEANTTITAKTTSTFTINNGCAATIPYLYVATGI